MHPRRGEPEILAHGQAVKHARHLGLDADASPGDVVRLDAGHILAAQEHRSGRRFELTRQHLEESALAGAVRTDQTAQLLLAEGEVDVLDREDAAEAHAQPSGLNQRHAHRDAPARDRMSNASRSPIVGTRPFGTRSTKATRMAPRTSGTLPSKACQPAAPLGALAPKAAVSHWIPTQPRIGPINVPRPPTITQMMICADCAKPKMVGLTKLPQLANRQPE